VSTLFTHFADQQMTPSGEMSSFRIIENQWIPLSEGIRLAARIWLPQNAEQIPVPAVLEFHPYRKRPGNERDDSIYPAFAKAGIAGLHVDIRGSGESEGVIDGEYTPLELANAAEVIAWIAAQPWCNGKVGMMGLSWSGSNSLQLAAMKPPALRAIISVDSTVDRYNDDLHYKDGVCLSDQFSWAATMLSIMSRSPDPAIVGEAWLAMWKQRLEEEPFFIRDWLYHQRRDELWKHGSICENFDEISIPALVIAGWYDGCGRNTPLKAVEGGPGTIRALIGPWVHEWPHLANPNPRADFITEAIDWWNHWLRDEPNGIDKLFEVRAYILDGGQPTSKFDHAAGYWVAKEKWRAPELRRFSLDGSGRLATAPNNELGGRALLRSPLDTGIASGHFYVTSAGLEYPGDQRVDDGVSLVFDSHILDKELVLLGAPNVQLILSSDAPLANIAVRLLDVSPDGTETRVSFGLLNLAHRKSNADPIPLIPGRDETLTMALDACGFRIPPGHKFRLALSTAYWPMMLPPPFNATLDLKLSGLKLSLPLLGEHLRIDIPEPANFDLAPRSETIALAETGRYIERDLDRGITRYRKFSRGGRSRDLAQDLVSGSESEDVWTIVANDPLSLTAECRRSSFLSRDEWKTETVSVSRLSCTETEWIISEEIEAFHNGEKVFSRQRREHVPRDCT